MRKYRYQVVKNCEVPTKSGDTQEEYDDNVAFPGEIAQFY